MRARSQREILKWEREEGKVFFLARKIPVKKKTIWPVWHGMANHRCYNIATCLFPLFPLREKDGFLRSVFAKGGGG